MKTKIKKGFTLAETLVTLGLIGVVAAIVAPSLIINTSSSKIGPALSKAKNSFENAVSLMLEDRGLESITEVGASAGAFLPVLQNYMKFDIVDSSYVINGRTQDMSIFPAQNRFIRFDANDSIVYWIFIENEHEPSDNYANIPNNRLCGQVYVDINGVRRPNRESMDVFGFLLYADGTLRPIGSEYSNRLPDAESDSTWRDGNCDETAIGRPATCTGSIFENDLRVIYE